MVRCAICNKELPLGFTCRRCGEHFCSKHRLPENHECAFINMRKEDISLKLQLEKNNNKKQEVPAQKRRYRSRFQRMEEFDDEEEEDGRSYMRSPVAMDFSITLVIFLIFAVMDVVYFVFLGIPLLVFPLVIHGIFLPVLFWMSYKQKRGQMPVGAVVTFLKMIITYMIVYMAVKIIVSFLSGDPFSATIYIIIGLVMTLMWVKILNQFSKIGRALR